ALKILRPEAEQGEDITQARARMQREAHALARLTHPNVTTIHDVGSFDGSIFIAMEYVEGQTLASWLKTPRPWREVVRIFIDAGAGLAAAHGARLVHRDFKPSNVLLGNDGRTRVMDFGVAREADGTHEAEAPAPKSTTQSSDSLSSPLTVVGNVVGTPGYM